jgi:DNA mismatch endonuclease (patch repair protein)
MMSSGQDIFSKHERSKIMSRIRGRGNRSTELAMVNLFRSHRITGWRRHYPITGKPDFAFPKNKVAVFVDGCFWHGCPKHAVSPKGNQAFWSAKLDGNKARDRKVDQHLRARGWRVIRIWEHDLVLAKRISVLRRITKAL